MLYIGIDLGTSAVKLLLMDQEGTVQNVVSKEYPLEKLVRDARIFSIYEGSSEIQRYIIGKTLVGKI